MPKPWSSVEKRAHPFGEMGVRSSLDEVAKKASKGATDPRVRTWAIEMLDRARGQGQSVKHPRERARVLLAAVQRKLWVPDPVGAEYIPAAHLLACDEKTSGQVCVRGDDCDGLATLLASALSSVGIFTLIVGHGYDREKHIEHVLCAAHLDNSWHYADPSTDLPLGKCVPFTRERLLSIPNIQVLCDDSVCLSDRGNSYDLNKFVERGVFVGVDGLPDLKGLTANVVWLVD